MKSMRILFVIFLTSIFIWMLVVTAFPIKLKGLDEKFHICEIGNIDSWLPIQAKPSSIKGGDFLRNKEDMYIEFLYPKQDQRPLFQCKKNFSGGIVYRAKTINAKLKINQPAEFNLGLTTGGIGPTWRTFIKPEDVNKPISLSWSLDREQSGNTLKFNWFPENFTGGGIYIENYDPNKDLIITLYEIYLE